MSEEKIVKSKFKIGQQVWHINYKCVSCDVIKALFVDKHGDVLVCFSSSEFSSKNDEYVYQFDTDYCWSEDTLFATKEALLTSLKKQEVE